MNNYTRATIVRAPHDTRYFCMSRETAQDRNLSWEARGVIAYILSKPDGWEIQVSDLKQNCQKGRIYRILDELKAAGYLQDREKKVHTNGKWYYTPYILHERPFLRVVEPENETKSPLPENRDTAAPLPTFADTENRDVIHNTEIQSTEKSISTAEISTLPIPAKIETAEVPPPVVVAGETTPEPLPQSKPDKLTNEEYTAFFDVLLQDFGCLGGKARDIYHQLRGSTADKSSKRYQYGELFRLRPVGLDELRGFRAYYRSQVSDDEIAMPTSAEALENWFGKYRLAPKPKKVVYTVSPPDPRRLQTDSAGGGVVRFEKKKGA